MSELVKYSKESLCEFFASGSLSHVLDAIKEEVAAQDLDPETKKGRDEIKSLAHKIARSKTFIDDIGKELVSEWKVKSSAVDSERRKVRDALDTLKDDIRKPVTDWEEKEKSRVERLTSKIESFKNMRMLTSLNDRSEGILEFINNLRSEVIDNSFGEFEEAANAEHSLALEYLEDLYSKRVKYEEEQAELERLRVEKAERDRIEYEENMKKEAAEKARIDAEVKAAREKEELERKLREEKERAEKAAIEAKRREQEVERLRIEAEKQAEADKQKAILAAKEAERARIDKENEKQRLQEEKRAASLKHSKKINNEILSTLMSETTIVESVAKEVISVIAQGKIPHIKIQY